MKRYRNDFEYTDINKRKQKEWDREHATGGFKCSHCKKFVVINDIMGTANRNHCNMCLWSKHVDEAKGDRRATCHAGMEPIGLTFKHEGYGRVGETMLIHLCSGCQKISINRIARDDPEYMILELFNQSSSLGDNVKFRLINEGISLLTQADSKELQAQLFGTL